MKRVKAKGVPVVVYEPTLDAPEFFGSEVTHDLEAFKSGCDVIVANRWSDELADVADKVYTRDLFKRDYGRGCLRWADLVYSKIMPHPRPLLTRKNVITDTADTSSASANMRKINTWAQSPN